MRLVGFMLARMILVRFVFVLLGISVFVATLDAVTYAKEILDLRDGNAFALLEYAYLRAPGILSTFLPISVLLAVLLALAELSYRNELVAIWASGVSPQRLMVMLLPAGIVLGCLHFLIDDRAVPAAAPELREWGIGDYGKKRFEVGEKDPLWMRSGPDILRASEANAQATELGHVTVFRRDPNGLLREQIIAESAKLSEGRWTLSNVLVYYRDTLEPNKLATLIYTADMRPAAAGARSGDPEEMSLSDLSYFIENSGFGIRPAWVYETWWHKRISFFLTAILMMALCLPLAVRFKRGGAIGTMFATGIGLGFVYFVVDGISTTMGELGFVPPWLAAWGPLMAFAALAASLGFRAETV